MSIQPELPDSSAFNPALFEYQSEGLSMDTADHRYIKIGSNASVASLTSSGFVDATSYKLSGSSIDLSSITGITPGTIAAGKAVIVDTNKDASSFRNVGMAGTLSMTGTNPMLSLSSFMSINNSCVYTSTSTPSNVVGMGLGYNGLASEGRLVAYNWLSGTTLNLNFNYSQMYLKGSNGCLGIGTTSPAYALDAVGSVRASACMLIGSSTDTTRMISALDSSMTNGTSRYITLGKSNSILNSAELSYQHAGDGSSSNQLRLGFNGGVVMTLAFNGNVGIGSTSLADKLTVDGTVNAAIGFKANNIDCINASGTFIGSGGVISGGRLVSTAALGFSQTHASYSNAEARIYCGNGSTYMGNNNNSLAYFGTANQVYITCKQHSGGRKATCIGGDTNDLYMLTVSGSLGADWTGNYGYLLSSGATGNVSNTTATNIAAYINGRILCQGELDVVSDLRRKTDICTLDASEVDRFIEEAVPKQFRYKNEQATCIGYIAQEVLRAGFTGLIDIHPNPDMEELIDDDGFVSPAGGEFSVRTGEVIPILHNKISRMVDQMRQYEDIIQDQRMTIDEHEEHIDDLTACVEQHVELIQDLMERLTNIEEAFDDLAQRRHHHPQML